MRMFRKIKETNKEVVYEYLCENYKLPYTGILKIKKEPFEIIVEKPADGEWNEEQARFSAVTLIKAKYPQRYTHAAV